MCMILKRLLREHIAEPPGLPDSLLPFRLIDVFTVVSDTDLSIVLLNNLDCFIRVHDCSIRVSHATM